jgi:protein tyrosine phosphatase (PTP) superfamily phosphohydrolase (DUF442 family)
VNYHEYSPSLLSSGQPTREQFPAIAQAGFEAVINLAMPDSPDALPDEPALAAARQCIIVSRDARLVEKARVLTRIEIIFSE